MGKTVEFVIYPRDIDTLRVVMNIIQGTAKMIIGPDIFFLLNLLLVRSHRSEISVVKSLI